MKIKYSLLVALPVLAFFGAVTSVFADGPIVHAYRSVRSVGMGGVFITTGLYEDNWYGNPARIAANPEWRVDLLSLDGEFNTNLLSNLSTFGNGNVKLSDIANTAGESNHFRFQMPFAFYIPTLESSRLSFAFALITALQGDETIRRNYEVDPFLIGEESANLTVARDFLDHDALSVGLTGRLAYRVSVQDSVSLADLIQGKSIAVDSIGGNGIGVDFDLGATYVLPIGPEAWDFSVGAALTNLLGGKYNGSHPISSIPNAPVPQPRALAFGGSAIYDEALGPFTEHVLALEFSDIGNNPDGSLFRTIHLGGETHWKRIALRAGLNQGYISAGLGLDLKFVSLDLATYGEEMSLNAGGLQNRIYAFNLRFQI